MKNDIALVTGGMGTIGTAIAQYLFNAGAEVVVTYNKQGDHNKAKKWQIEQEKNGYKFAIFYVDVASFESTKQMINDVIGRFSRINILVNNAGVTNDTTLLKMSENQWSDVINNNLTSIFNVTHNVLKNMIENQYGRIINISSVNGQKGQFGQTNYCAAKAGIIGFTRALAYEVAKKGITVNTVSPGYVNSSMIKNMPEHILQSIISQIPVGRLANPEEIARAVTFLASRESGYITGSNVSINGGQHMV